MGRPCPAAIARRRLVHFLPLPFLLAVLDFSCAILAFCPSAAAGIAAIRRFRADAQLGGNGHDTKRTALLGKLNMMATAVAPPPRTRAEKKDEFFRVKDRMVEFGSSQYVEAPVSGASLAMMQEYLKDPARIIYACWDHDDIIPMGDGMFRMVFSGQNFLSVSIDLSVDIKLRVDENGNILCKSIGYSVEDMAKLLGQEFVDTFFLELEGELRVEESVTKVRALTLKGTLLSGDVGVTVGGKMPALLAATPEPLVKTAALGINQRVLEYVSSTFVATIANDFRQWAREQKRAPG